MAIDWCCCSNPFYYYDRHGDGQRILITKICLCFIFSVLVAFLVIAILFVDIYVESQPLRYPTYNSQYDTLFYKEKEQQFKAYNLSAREVDNKNRSVYLEATISSFEAFKSRVEKDRRSSSDKNFDIEDSNFVEYYEGNMAMILTVPHGGYIQNVDSIPNRERGCKLESTITKPSGEILKKGCVYKPMDKLYCPESSRRRKSSCSVVLGSDLFTMDIAHMLFEFISQKTGGKSRPYMVINKLHRSKLDANRPIDNAAQGDGQAERAYKTFHNFIKKAKENILKRQKEETSCQKLNAILFDIHGQNHESQNSTELGYLFLKSELNKQNLMEKPFDSSASSGTTDWIAKSSIQMLIRRLLLQDIEENDSIPEVDRIVPYMLSGAGSLGRIMEERGIRAVPSPRQKSPGNDKYYRGGYITQTHGSRKSDPPNSPPTSDAIQVEIPRESRIMSGLEGRKRYAEILADSFLEFYNTYYNDNENVTSLPVNVC